MSFTASDVLLKAASRIEEEGMWCQGEFWRGTQVCALAALLMTANELHATYQVVQEGWDTFIRTHGTGLVTFNDTPGRTAHEVAEAMRQAALQ